MAHSLFEPAPEPFGERVWRRVKDIGLTAGHGSLPPGAARTDPALLAQAQHLDARGRQQLLQAMLTARPIKK